MVVSLLAMGLVVFTGCEKREVEDAKKEEKKVENTEKEGEDEEKNTLQDFGDLNLIEGQSKEITFTGVKGDIEATLSSKSNVLVTAEGNKLKIQAIKCDARALNATEATVTVSAKGVESKTFTVNVFNKMGLGVIRSNELFVGESTVWPINAGYTAAFKFTYSQENTLEAKVEAVEVSGTQLQQIAVKTLAAGECELTVTDGVSSLTQKIVVKEMEPVEVLAANESADLVPITEFTLVRPYDFTLRGGSGEYTVSVEEADKAKVEIDDVDCDGEDALVRISPVASYDGAGDIVVTVVDTKDKSRKTTFTIHLVAKLKVTCFNGADPINQTPDAAVDNEFTISVQKGVTVKVKLEGLSGQYGVYFASYDESKVALGGVEKKTIRVGAAPNFADKEITVAPTGEFTMETKAAGTYDIKVYDYVLKSADYWFKLVVTE